MDYGASDEEPFNLSQRGLFITCEGNFCYGNASLSFYIPSEKRVENEIFIRANAFNLGDVAQSMTLHEGKGYVVVNNSSVVYVINTDTFAVTGMITGLTSPRYIHFADNGKAYITDLYDPRVAVVDTRTNRIIGRISMNGHKSTEQMVQYGSFLFTNCWSYDNKILIIDTEKDRLVDSITVGRQPTSLVLDKHNKLWTLTDGRYASDPAALYRIDAATRTIEQTYAFDKGAHPSELALNGARDTLYFINESVWRMPVTDTFLPYTPFLTYNKTLYYGLTVDPVTSEVYVADAIDYVQPGVVYRFTAKGHPVDTLRVGITPGAFCFKPKNH